MSETRWFCVRCGTEQPGNPRWCVRCGHTVYRPEYGSRKVAAIRRGETGEDEKGGEGWR